MPAWNFDEQLPRRGTNCIKYDAPAEDSTLPQDFIPMWVADMDFACPEPLLRAMHDRLDKRILGYSNVFDPAYYTAVDRWMQTRHGFSAPVESIVLFPGVVDAMHAAVNRLTAPGDKVLMHTPGYHPFEDATLQNGREAVYSPLVQDENGVWQIDWQDFEQKLADPQVKLLFLCSPHNPTGRIWTEEELRRIAEGCFQNRVFLFVDEIHHDLTRVEKSCVSLASLYPNRGGYLTATAPSKTFNCPGNGLSNIILYDTDMARVWRRHSPCPHPLSIAATQAAYESCADWLDALREYLDGNFAFLADFLQRELPAARFRIPDATYLAWVDLSGYGLSAAEMSERTRRAGLLIQFAGDFIRDGEGFARINLGCPRATLAEGLKRLKTALTAPSV